MRRTMARRTTEKPTTTKKTRAASSSRKAGDAAASGSGVVKKEEDSADAALQGGKGKQPARAPRMENETAGQDTLKRNRVESSRTRSPGNMTRWSRRSSYRLSSSAWATGFICGKGYGYEQWYSRVAHHVKIELAKNKGYMKTHGSLLEERFGRAEMQHLRGWFVAQKENYTTAMKKKGTGSEGGRIQRSPNKIQQLRAHIFSGNAAANKRKFMLEVVSLKNGKRHKVAHADAGGAASASGGGASSGQGGGKGKGKRRQSNGVRGGGDDTSGKSQAPGGDDATGEGSGGGKNKSRRKAAMVAAEEDDQEDPPMDVGGDDWAPSESEDEEELRSRGGAGGEGGMSDGDLQDVADDSSPDVVEVKRKGRRRKSDKLDPKSFQLTATKERDARDKVFTSTMLQGVGMIIGGHGQDGSGAADGAGGASGVNRGKMEAAEKSVSLLRSSWMDSIVAEKHGYGSQAEVKGHYDKYQAAVARQQALISGVNDG
ncbi:expressed unknown protein [Ectocarpus siliculosus]|uniref:Uncharacterized protein n=1 Tax=Ectocarpus siliculosus TaxID=2880 RepID=D7G1M7_ECTSI|nr:expressed unknown protein [Ectocarpus siliculosus]|eukprot:CBJ33272.1 expressed unknown protein [Ectocarpus siliculosus]